MGNDKEAAYTQRLNAWKQRQQALPQVNRKVASHHLVITNADEDTTKEFERFSARKNAINVIEAIPTSISQGNTAYCRLAQYKYSPAMSKPQKVMCRIYSLNHFGNDKSFSIQDYFSKSPAGSKYFQQLQKVFEKEIRERNYTTKLMYVFLPQLPSSSLAHKLWNMKVEKSKKNPIPNWIQQLANAVDILNQAGVCHRFIRLENVLLDKDTIKLSCFDMACFFLKENSDQEYFAKVPRQLWDHLPEECFTEVYNAEHVDIWSVGVVFCTLVATSHPFNIKEPASLVQQWRQSSERFRMAENFRSLLDDIFQPTHRRLTSYDLVKDSRLGTQSGSTTKETSSYYRIDQYLNNPPPAEAELATIKSNLVMNNHLVAMHNYKPYETITSENDLNIKNFVVLRNQSFTADSTPYRHEHFLKAMVNNSDQYLVKIFLLYRLPEKHRHMLVKESGPILRYLSDNPVVPSLLSIEKMFALEKKQHGSQKHKPLYIFYKNELRRSKSFRQLADEQAFRSIETLHSLLQQCADNVQLLASLGVAHRYIRPEHVYFTTKRQIKMARNDMVCFTHNVSNELTVRTKGLHDLQEHNWDHLPPECFQDKYYCTALDAWSFGVLLVYCLTQQNPFKVPHSNAEARRAWNDFKVDAENGKQLAPYIQFLNRIFLPFSDRIPSLELADIFKRSGPTDSLKSTIGGPTSSLP